MSQAPSFYFYDYETWGADPKKDRPAQFAGIRTDSELNIIGEPDMWYCQLANDYLPHPAAALITGLTPQICNQKGLPETEFCRRILERFSQPNTCVLGYNSLRFDDNRNLVEENRKISRCHKRAEGLEKILYKCPRCGAEFKNVTKGNVMKCTQCGNTVEYGRDGILHAIKGKTFDYISDWYDFERQDLKEQVTDENFRLEGEVALYVNNEKLNKFVKDGEGTLSVSKDGIQYVGETGENKSLEFKIENRGTIAFKMGENLEVSEDGNIYRFAFTEGLFSTKFVLAIEELHKRYFD